MAPKPKLGQDHVDAGEADEANVDAKCMAVAYL